MDVVLIADKGGVGKSTLAWCLAHRMQQMRRDVMLVDLDQRASLLAWGRLAEGEDYPPVCGAEDLDHATAEVRVWDTPAHASVKLRQSLLEVDALFLVVATADPVSLPAGAELCRWLLERGGRAVVVVNLVQPTSADGHHAIDWLMAHNVPCLPCYVRSYRCYTHAQWSGRCPADGPYASADAAWSDIIALTDAVLELEVQHA